MPQYDIKRWDAAIPKKNDHPMPMIYIKPDKDFIDYAKENDYQVIVEISGTGKQYDGKKIPAVIDSSGFFPNFRPYFYNDTGYFVLTLFASWDGYPKTGLGHVVIRGLKGPDKVTIPPPKEFTPPIPVELYKPTPKMQSRPRPRNCSKLSTAQIGWTLSGLLIVFGVLLYISFNKNKPLV